MCNMILSAIICGSPFFLPGDADNIVKYSKICEKKQEQFFWKSRKTKTKKELSCIWGEEIV